MDTFSINDFTAGKNNIAKETSLPDKSLREALNVDIDNSGKVRQRNGYTKIYSGINVSSIYKRYFCENGTLKYLNDDNTATDIISGLSPTLNYVEFNNIIYVTDGFNNYKLSGINVYHLSIPTPTLVGSIPADGDIQITYAYRDQLTGEIGGAPLALANSTSYNKSGYDLIRYETTGDDGRLYTDDGTLCETQFMEPLPGGQIIEYYKGRLYIAEGSTLWFSEPHRYGLTLRESNFFNFPERITICLSSDNGLFIVADKTYFIGFDKNETPIIKTVTQSKAVEGTGIKILATDLRLNEFNNSDIAYWFSDSGANIGLPNGKIINLSEDVLAVADNTSKFGNSIIKKYNGITQIISSMSKGGEISKLQSNDSATLTIIRNGVEI